MSAFNSNLTPFGYDLVVGVTEKSLNDILEDFFEDARDDDGYFEAFFIKNPEHERGDKNPKMTEVSKEAFEQKMGRPVDDHFPFEVKANSEEEADMIKKGFYIAISGNAGGNDLGAKVLELVADQGTEVNFRLLFENVKIRYKSFDDGEAYIERFDQEDLFYFEYLVPLNLKADDFSNLPKEQQDRLKNLDQESMFSVQQLYIDLTSASLAKEPELKGVDGDCAYQIKEYLTFYWKSLKEKDISLGHVVLPKARGIAKLSSLTPTDLNFQVLPYLVNGKPSDKEEDQDFRTLNYLIMSENRPLPENVNRLNWNWVQNYNDPSIAKDSDDYRFKPDGVMSVRRDIILDYFNQHIKAVLTGTLKSLQYVPGEMYNLERKEASIKLVEVETKDIKFEDQTHGGWTFTAQAEHVKPYHFVGKHTLDEKVKCESRFSGGLIFGAYDEDLSKHNKITFYYHFEHRLEFSKTETKGHDKSSSGKSETFSLAQKIELELAVANGQIQVIAGNPETVPNPETGPNLQGIFGLHWPKRGHWNPFDDGGGKVIDTLDLIYPIYNEKDIGNTEKKADENCANMAKAFSDKVGEYTQYINRTNAWIFPGGNTFFFKNLSFSEEKDLVVYLTYK